MLNCVDRILIAVPSAGAAAETYSVLFGASPLREDEVPTLGARRTVMAVGRSEVEILEPAGTGPVERFVSAWGSGLFGVGFASSDIPGLKRSIDSQDLTYQTQGKQIFVDPTPVGGLRVVLSPYENNDARQPVGLLDFIYEVTNPVADWKAAALYYAKIFGIDATRFRKIESKFYGYTGTLTLFDPATRLDRIEITQITDETKAMGRFHSKRGDSLYMCFAETSKFEELKDRLTRVGAQFAIRPPEDGAGDPNVLFIHPRSLHGMLMGVSSKGVAWEWSSGPSLALAELEP